MEAFPQVVQEGTFTRVGVQENKILDAHTIPGCQRGLHVPQDLVTALVQTLCPSSNTSEAREHDSIMLFVTSLTYNYLRSLTKFLIFCYFWPHSFYQAQSHESHPFPLCPVFLKSYLSLS